MELQYNGNMLPLNLMGVFHHMFLNWYPQNRALAIHKSLTYEQCRELRHDYTHQYIRKNRIIRTQTLAEISQTTAIITLNLALHSPMAGEEALTCGVPLNDWQVIHLQRGITPTPRELHHVVLPVVHKLGLLLDVDVVCAHVEDHSHIALFLKRRRRCWVSPGFGLLAMDNVGRNSNVKLDQSPKLRYCQQHSTEGKQKQYNK